MVERWWIDGYELTKDTMGWEVREGTDEWTGLVGAEPTLAGRDGSMFRRRNLAPGTLSLSLWLRGANQTQVRTLWGELLRVVGRRTRTVMLRRQLPDGEQISARGTLSGAMKPTHLGQRGIRAGLTFSIPYGKWWSSQSYTYLTTGGQQSTVDMPELAASTAPIWAIFRITGPCTQFVLEDQSDPLVPSTDRERFIYSGTIPAGVTVTMAPETWQLSASTGAAPDLEKVRFTGRRYFDMEPAPPGGTHKVRFTFNGGTSATRLEVVARRWYLV